MTHDLAANVVTPYLCKAIAAEKTETPTFLHTAVLLAAVLRWTAR